jgi:hypothetical protein
MKPSIPTANPSLGNRLLFTGRLIYFLKLGIYVTCRYKSLRKKKRQSYTCNTPWRHIGLWDVEAPTFSRQSAYRWWWLQPYALASRLLHPGRSLVLISVRSWVDPRATVRLEGLRQLKIQWPHRESNSRPSGLEHSTSTNYATACPLFGHNYILLTSVPWSLTPPR